nr:anti-phage ZorAB system protein ZorA [Pseudomonas otitidis]
MMDLLKHLIPDFAHMFSANPNGISAWFWLATALIFGLSLYFLFVHFRRFRTRLSALRSLLEGQSKETLALSRRETMQKAQGLDAPNVGMLWREFDESLVLSSDQKHLFNTLDAEHFFNARTLAPGLTASRLLAAAPSFLVAIGVLGTFVGLTVGLEGLVGTSDEIESLKGGINKLISGAAVAFMTSVWGVFFSLLLNFLEKMFERNALNAIQKLQHDIDSLYTRTPAEQSLVLIAEYGKESKEALQELHERIGDRLQETLNGMSEAMQTALTDALNNIMAPAIQTLVSTTSQQSTQVLEKLVGNFMDGMTSVGREQGGVLPRFHGRFEKG